MRRFLRTLTFSICELSFALINKWISKLNRDNNKKKIYFISLFISIDEVVRFALSLGLNFVTHETALRQISARRSRKSRNSRTYAREHRLLFSVRTCMCLYIIHLQIYIHTHNCIKENKYFTILNSTIAKLIS